MRRWLRDWWLTVKYGSPLTRAGRDLRRNRRDPLDPENYIEVERP